MLSRYEGRTATDTDAEIIAASRSDPERFGAIFDRHFDAIYRYLACRIGADLAGDLSSEVFSVAFRQRSRYDATRADARPWLAAIRAQAETNSNPLGWEMLVIVGDLLRESVAPLRLRASLYEVATTIPGIELVGPATDRAGRHGIAVAVTRNDLRYELIFDPKTSQLLAEAETLIQRSSDTDARPGTPISYTLFLDSRITHSLTEPDGSK